MEWLRPGDFYAAYLLADTPDDATFDPWVPVDPAGQNRPTNRTRWCQSCHDTLPANVPTNILYCPTCANAPTPRCLICQDTAATSRLETFTLNKHGLCAICAAHVTRLDARRRLPGLWVDRTSPVPCGLCGAAVTTVIHPTRVGLRSEPGGINTDLAAWSHPSSPWVCVPCASLYLGLSARSQGPGSSTLWIDNAGTLRWRVREQVPWWDAPPAPCWIVHYTNTKGTQVFRLAHTEISLDPRWVIVNRIHDANRHTRATVLPRASSDLQATLHHQVDILARCDDLVALRDAVAIQATQALDRPLTGPQSATRDDLVFREARRQLHGTIRVRRHQLGLPPLKKPNKEEEDEG